MLERGATLTAVSLAILAIPGVLWRMLRGMRPAMLAMRLRPARRLLAIEEMLPLDGKRRLVMVRCGERNLLLLIGGAQDRVVAWLDDTAKRAP
jgi:flagellar protein FliO/FliZ